MAMDRDRQERRAAWGISACVHAGIFLAAALSGVFVMQAPQDADDVYDVAVYDTAKTAEAAEAEAGDDGGTSGGGADDVVLDVSQDSSEAAQELAESLQERDAAQEQAREAGETAADMGKHPVDDERKPTAKKVAMAAPRSSEGAAKTGGAGGTAGSAAGSSSGGGSGPGSSGGPGTGSHGGSGGGDLGGSGTGTQGSGTQGGAPARDPELVQQAKTPARLVSGASPEYPSDLEGSGAAGSVGLSILVSAGGHVESVSVESSSGYGELDRAAVAAAHTYHFSPARNVYDEPVRSRVHQVVSFAS